MANKNSRNSQEWTIGSIVNFKKRNTGERFQGTVYYFSPQPQGSVLGIKNVTIWRVDGRCEHSTGFYHFNLNDITDDQDNNNDDGSSSKSIEGKMGSLRLDPPSEIIIDLTQLIDKAIRNRLSSIRRLDTRYEEGLVTWFAARGYS